MPTEQYECDGKEKFDHRRYVHDVGIELFKVLDNTLQELVAVFENGIGVADDRHSSPSNAIKIWAGTGTDSPVGVLEDEEQKREKGKETGLLRLRLGSF